MGVALASDQVVLQLVMVPPPARGTPALYTAMALAALWYRKRRDDGRVNLAALQREAKARWMIFPRYLLNAAVLASELYLREDSEWKPVVDLLIRRSRAVVLDISFLDDSAHGLRWELELCRKLGVPHLCLCHISQAGRVRGSQPSLNLTEETFLTYGKEGLALPAIIGFLRAALARKQRR